MFLFFLLLLAIGVVLFSICCEEGKGLLMLIGFSASVFGLVAAITHYNSEDAILSTSIGGVSVVVILGLFCLDRIMSKHETKTRNLYLGKEAVITIPTNLNRYGQIQFDAPVTKNDSEMRAQSKSPISSGVRVKVIDQISKYVVIVEAVEQTQDND